MLRLGRTTQLPPDLLGEASTAAAAAMAGTDLRLLIAATCFYMTASHRLGYVKLR